MKTPDTRLDFITALRGLAAVTVLISHIGERLSPAFERMVKQSFDLGNFGVILFFICSGFVIPPALEREGSLARFWVRRAFRLYPLYWFTIIVSVAWAYSAVAAQTALGPFLGRNAPIILGNLTMVELFLGIPYIRPEYWTLMFEMLFYGLVSLLFVARAYTKTVAIVVGLMAAAVLVEALPPFLTGQKYPIGIVGFLCAMFMGTLWYRVHSGELRQRVALWLSGLYLLTIVVTKLASPAGAGGAWQFYRFMLTELAAFLVFAVAFLARGRRYPRLALFLGDRSYSLYLLQTYALAPDFGSAPLNAVLWTVILLLATAAAYRWIERPCMDVGRHLARRLAGY
jgi:peptidoglycan/LPS O-acetylase OafA/YrhL